MGSDITGGVLRSVQRFSWINLLWNLSDFVGISDYAEIVEEEGDYSCPDGKYITFLLPWKQKENIKVDLGSIS